MSAAPMPQLAAAQTLMRQRRFAEARRLLEPVVRSAPRSVDARLLLGVALRMDGQAEAAAQQLRAAQALAPAREDVLVELARALASSGDHAGALAATASAAARPSEAMLVERARALKALGRAAEYLAMREQIAALYPLGPRAHHNLAAALGDAGMAERAEASARAAMARGGEAPETWLVLARAMQAQNRFDEADVAFAEALRRRSGYIDALRDRAQLRWMRTADLPATVAMLAEAEQDAPAANKGKLRAIIARLFASAGEEQQGYDLLLRPGIEPDPVVEITAAELTIRQDAPRALGHALRAETLAPNDEGIRRRLIDVWLAMGEPARAMVLIDDALMRAPYDQGLIAARWTAWRLLDDPRATALYDYEAVVLAQTIATPPGWSDLAGYLADLAVSLRQLHLLHTHPLDQSLRHGTQTSVNLLLSDDPAIRAFVAAVDAPVEHYMRRIGSGEDVLRRRNGTGYRLSGMWSVRLRAGGYHVDHVHPLGWLSSAFYVALPEEGQAESREGWIRFGEPGAPTTPPLHAEHVVRPEPGLLVIFPSYMWHGTVPFAGTGERLTIAFDVVLA